MNELPPLFRQRFRQHNHQCWLSALGLLLAAWLGWVFFYGIFAALALLFETIRFGENAEWPRWLNPAAAITALVMLILAAIRQRLTRFQSPRDRPVIGWHLFSQVLLLPAVWTLAIAQHLDARLKLSEFELYEAFRLLGLVWESDKPTLSSLGYHFSDQKLLTKLLSALQMIGWIDLHRSDEDWYYRPVGTREEELRSFFIPPPEEATA